MQTGRKPRLGSLLLALWALAVLILTLAVHLGLWGAPEGPYDGATLVRATEAARHV